MDDTRFQIGEIVYFVRTNQRTIDWGVCQDYYCDGYGLSLYEIPDFRTICGVPIQTRPAYALDGARTTVRLL